MPTDLTERLLRAAANVTTVRADLLREAAGELGRLRAERDAVAAVVARLGAMVFGPEGGNS